MKKNVFVAMLMMIVLSALFLSSCDSLSVTEEQSINFKIGQERSLNVKTKNGSINVNGWDKDYISIEAIKKVSGVAGEDELRKLLDQVEIITIANGVNASVIVEFPDEINGFFNGGFSFGASLDMYVPNQFKNSDLKSSNGRIEINDIDSNIYADTSNGRIRLYNVSGNISLDTSNGSVDLDRVVFKDGRNVVDTSNGNISGDFTLPENGSVDFDTSNGRIDVEIPSDSKANLDADTSNGNININGIMMNITHESKSDMSADLNGGGIYFRLKSSNGNISVTGR